MNAADSELQDILLQNDVYPILKEIGYHGVPSRENKPSIRGLIQ